VQEIYLGRNNPMLKVVDIHTYYGDSYVLQGISLEIAPEQVIVLLGRNGVGKTTLIRSIAGFTPARRGQILFQGRDITRLSSTGSSACASASFPRAGGSSPPSRLKKILPSPPRPGGEGVEF